MVVTMRAYEGEYGLRLIGCSKGEELADLLGDQLECRALGRLNHTRHVRPVPRIATLSVATRAGAMASDSGLIITHMDVEKRSATTPDVTVVIPTHNRPALLIEALESVADQDRPAPYQLLEMGEFGLQTEFGPGDVGGRWYEDIDGITGISAGDHFFLCPLLGPGR